MNGPLTEAFARVRARGEGALVAYAMAGDPDLERSFEAFVALADGGADVLELGIPFSDPIADGPVIQAAASRALASGTTLARVLDELSPRLAHARPGVPLVAMTYYNLVLTLGEQAFARRARAGGLAGVIVPDLPPEEATPLRDACDAAGIDLIPLCAPTTPPARAAKVAADARGFVYAVSVAGVTGARDALPVDLEGRLALLRSATNLPVVVGFGVSTEAHAAALRPHADGVVVGSALVRALASGGPPAARALCEAVKRGLRG